MLVRAHIVLALMICGLPLHAQSWDAVRGLKPGDRVNVLDNSGQTYNGALISVGNEPSMKLARKLGFIQQPDGIYRDKPQTFWLRPA